MVKITSGNKKKYGTIDVFNLSEWGRPIARITAQFLEKKTNLGYSSYEHTFSAFLILCMVNPRRLFAGKLFPIGH